MQKSVIIQLRNGSYEAFDTLYNQYFDLLYGFIFSLTRSHEIATELVQETFIKVWLNRQKIDPALSFKAWLDKIAKNRLIDQFKKKWNDPLFEDYLNYCSDENLQMTSEEGSFDFEAFYILLNKAKQKLSPSQIKVFELCKEQDYSATEVARQLQISEQAVYNYLSQAKAILQKEMSPHKSLLLWFFWIESELFIKKT